jgi:hypothetical protein
VSVLSIFVDESGDFSDDHGYYILSIVFHEQQNSIQYYIDWLTSTLRTNGLDNQHAIQTGPAIRGENEYRDTPMPARRKEFGLLHNFARRLPITFQTFQYEKRQYDTDRLKLKGALSRDLGRFLMENTSYLLAFDKVIVYYDNGQAEITDILNTILNAYFFNVDFRKVLPAQYRLFQVADLCCTLQLLRIKDEKGILSRSDLLFFGNARSLRKDYLNKLEPKRFPG